MRLCTLSNRCKVCEHWFSWRWLRMRRGRETVFALDRDSAKRPGWCHWCTDRLS